MTPLQSLHAAPPLDAVMPHAQVGLIWAWAALAVCSAVYCLVTSLRTRTLLPIAIFLGAGLAMFGESLVIQNMHTWYPAIDQINAYKAFGQSVPMFAALAYWFYFAPAILFFMKQYENGISQTQFWVNCLLAVLGVVCYEIAGLRYELWSYYGVQPFTLRGMPLTWVFLNASTVIPASVILYRFRAELYGWRTLLVIAFMSAQVPAFEFLTGYPLYIAISSQCPPGVPQAAAVLSISFVIALFWVCSQMVCKPTVRT